MRHTRFTIFMLVCSQISMAENYIPLSIDNNWVYRYTYYTESESIEIDDSVYVEEETQVITSIDSIAGHEAYRMDNWEGGNVPNHSEWYTENDSGLFVLAFTNPPDSSQPSVQFKVGNQLFSSLRQIHQSLIKSSLRDTSIFEPPRKLLQYPLLADSSWIWFTDPWHAVRTWVGSEEVGTIIGPFNCEKIQIDYYFEEDVNFYEWWSEGVGLIKRSISIYEIILIDENGNVIGSMNAHFDWELTASNTTSTIAETQQIKSLEVHPVYPNPFNPSTTISYALHEPSKIRITIYDIAGRPVRQFGDFYFSAGFHQTIWDGSDDAGVQIGSGVFIAHVQAGKYSRAIRLICLK